MLGVDVVAPYLLELTTEEQRERCVPDFCAGGMIPAIGMTEPQAGSDLAGMQTTARSATATAGSSTAPRPSSPTAAAPTWSCSPRDTGEDRKDISIFVVEAATPRASAAAASSRRSASTRPTPRELFFDDVRLPADNLIGEQGGASPT